MATAAVLCVSGQRYAATQELQHGYHGHSDCQIDTRELPKHPEYASLNARVTSYLGWNCPSLCPEDMAEAGFYYTGIRDYVLCFHCGGGVRDWDMNDNPWTEHERWFPNCDYLKQRQNRARQSRPVDLSSLLPPSGPATLPHYSRSSANRTGNISSTSQTVLTESGASVFEPTIGPKETTNGRKQEAALEKSMSNMKLTEKTVTQKLLEENRQMKEEWLCKKCLVEDACIVSLPCGHLVACMQCSHKMTKCAVCGTNILDRVRVYSA